MEKKILGICIVVLMLIALVSGCTETSDDEASSEPKTVTMNAQEYGEDMDIQMSQTSMTQNLKSLNDGDTLVFQDSISTISYDNTTDITTITFEYTQEAQTSTNTFIFEGNLTSDYTAGDEVKITVKIKEISVTIQGMALKMEIPEGYWQSEEYFTENYMTGNPYIPLSSSKIVKV